MTNTQQELSELIHFILNRPNCKENYNNPGLRDVLAHVVRHYPEINSDNERTWKKVDKYIKHFRISDRAVKIIEDSKGEKDLWKKLHFEHITPISVTMRELLELNQPNLNDIRKILADCEVIILSKEEAKVLDGSPRKEYCLDGVETKGKGLRANGSKGERLNSIEANLDNQYKENKL